MSGHRADSVQGVSDLTQTESANWVRLKLAIDKGRLREPFSFASVAALFGCDVKSAERAIVDLRNAQRVMLCDNRRGHVLVRGKR